VATCPLPDLRRVVTARRRVPISPKRVDAGTPGEGAGWPDAEVDGELFTRLAAMCGSHG
jgi:hypothetical protein